jgi:predicted transcriptional regulator
MKTQTLNDIEYASNNEQTLADSIQKLEEACKNCKPITPLQCVMDCKVWRLKNEYRQLHKKMGNPRYMIDLLNSLKNTRRLQALELLSRERATVAVLQVRLEKKGFIHSQNTIVREYLLPLEDVGLIENEQNQYWTTEFGNRILGLIKDLQEFGETLPAHSECFEETASDILLDGPKTFEDLKTKVPAASIARVLMRLQEAGLITGTEKRDYIFYLRTKRRREKEDLSPTEERVYEGIPAAGVAVRKLAPAIGLSLRRTYKYLRKLRGKKLVFTRKIPKVYELTAKGAYIAVTLRSVHSIALETLLASAILTNDHDVQTLMTLNEHNGKIGLREDTAPLTAWLQH